MAQRRMFNKSIIDTDNFMDLTMSAKAVYFLLGMEADDEGFVSAKKILRLYGGNEDDVKILVAKKFIIPFKSGVVVITDWHENNYLDKNRIRPTQHQAERQMLALTSGGKYELNIGLTDAKQKQASIVQSSVEESRTEDIHIDFEVFWELYPKKVEKKKAQEKWERLDRATQDIILADLPKRIAGDTWARGFILNPTTYLNGERWNDEISSPKPQSKAPQNVDRI